MKTHFSKTVSCCFNRSGPPDDLSRAQFSSRVIGVVSTWLWQCDPCRSVSLLSYELNRLQSVLNAAARLIFSGKKHDHVSPLLCDLHWLRVLDYQCFHGIAPAYLSSELQNVKDLPSAYNHRRRTSYSRSDIAAVNCWRSCFSSCCRTSLECSLSRGVISASFQTSAEDSFWSSSCGAFRKLLQQHLTNWTLTFVIWLRDFH